MNLSKFFKNSESFQPENIVKDHPPDKRGWKSLIKEQQSDPFLPGQQIKEVENPSNLKEKEPLPSSSLDVTQKKENDESHTSGQTLDIDKHIEIPDIEERLKIAFDEGVQRGLEKAEEDYGSATRSFAALCRQLDTVRETIIGNSSRELQEFALAIAERIIRTSLRDNDTTIIATIDEALQRAVKSDEFYIFIHPDDYETVEKKSNDLISGLSGLSNIVIKKDITVEKGGAKIESDNCTIDATIAGQFDVILNEIKKRL